MLLCFCSTTFLETAVYKQPQRKKHKQLAWPNFVPVVVVNVVLFEGQSKYNVIIMYACSQYLELTNRMFALLRNHD